MNIFFYLSFLFLTTTLQALQVPIVWQGNREGLFETDWIREVLSEIDTVDVDDGRFEVMMDRSIVVLSNDDGKAEYFKKMHEKGYTFGVIVLSDEVYAASSSFYPYAAFVFRNYWHKQYAVQENVEAFPLGYVRGFLKEEEKEILSAFERRYTWSFIGQIVDKPTREAMFDQMRKVPNYLLHETFAWGLHDPQALSPAACRNVLLDSIFVPCPRGWWNLDSFRVSEALECGCIPIVENTPLDYFTLFYGEHPFLSVDSWKEAPRMIQQLLSRPQELEEKRRACQEWWIDYKKEMKKKLATIIRSNFS